MIRVSWRACPAESRSQNVCRFCACICFYGSNDIGSLFGHPGHEKNLFFISLSGCGHGTAAVAGASLSYRAGPNSDEPLTKLKVRVEVGGPETRPRCQRPGQERAAPTGHRRRRPGSQAASPPCQRRAAPTRDVWRVYYGTPPRARTRRAGRDGRPCRAAASHSPATSRAAAGPR
jgi:hypothetical protein